MPFSIARTTSNSLRHPLFPTLFLYIPTLICLLLYSYSQVDLNLTLSSHPLYQSFQHQLTNLGYFHRPLSTTIYLLILSSLFICYLSFIRLASKGFLTLKHILILIITTIAILILSYPAFSYDIFNYIFDARIFVHHQANPYTHTALDFPNDLWTRFMRWTHRTYPYGPSWLPLSIVFYVLGFGKFVPTLFSFKLLGALSYAVSVISLLFIAKHNRLKNIPHILALFVLNPLIIIESLVSVHLDISMAALMLLGLYLVLSRHRVLGFTSLLLSILIKYVSAPLAPLLYLHLKHKLTFSSLITFSLIGSYAITFMAIMLREILPWYFIVPFALTALIPRNRYAATLMFALTIATLIRYAPFLYFGDYTPQLLHVRELLTAITFFATLILSLRFNPIPSTKSG